MLQWFHSFNLFNEPAGIDPSAHRKVVARVVEAIREQDRDRLIICDGREWGDAAPAEEVGLAVAGATRGYQSSRISRYKASWVKGADQWPEPTWPVKEGEPLCP